MAENIAVFALLLTRSWLDLDVTWARAEQLSKDRLLMKYLKFKDNSTEHQSPYRDQPLYFINSKTRSRNLFKSRGVPTMDRGARDGSATGSFTFEKIPTRENGLSQPNFTTVLEQAPIYARASVPEFGKAGWKSLSLYSGCGGLDLGFMQEGFFSEKAYDVDRHALATYDSNLPRVSVHGDLSMTLPCTEVVTFFWQVRRVKVFQRPVKGE